MIKSMKLLGILHRQDILYVLHHTDGGCITPRVAADRTDVGIADVVTHPTILHLLLQLRHGMDKLLHRLVGLAQSMKDKAQS